VRFRYATNPWTQARKINRSAFNCSSARETPAGRSLLIDNLAQAWFNRVKFVLANEGYWLHQLTIVLLCSQIDARRLSGVAAL
jgi:hypothetical protein